MTENKQTKLNLILVIMIIAGLSTRFFIHLPNFTAIGAIALFSGAWFSNKRLAIIFPMMLLLVSDAVLGFHTTMPFVYFSFLLIILIGFYLRNHKNWLYILGGSLTGSVLFYLITNFGVWMTGMGLSDRLIQVYIDGLPFFRNMVASDLIFNAIFFGSAYVIFRKMSILPAFNDR